MSGQSQLYNFSINGINNITGSCNSSQYIRLLVYPNQTSTDLSTALQNDLEEILEGIYLVIAFGQKEAPSIVGEFYFNPDITNETIKTVNYTNIDYTVDWEEQGFSCLSQRWVKDQDYIEFNGLKVIAYANLTDDQIPHDQPFKTCDHIDEDSWNFILLLVVVLMLVVILSLIIACLCMTGACACFIVGFTQWIARLRSRDAFKTCDHIDEDLWNFVLLLTVVLILIVLLALVIARGHVWRKSAFGSF
uniref:Uncharacterized protein n=1 Tax=Acrobeloides nanus TaxID=290746 RepID=A0A914E6Z6_9BILA